MTTTSFSAGGRVSSKVPMDGSRVTGRSAARAWALVLLSALLQIASFPVAGPLPYWRSLLGWFAIVPLIVAILGANREGTRASVRTATLLGYGCGILWYGGNCYWIYQTMYLYGGLPKPVAILILVLFSLYLGLYHGLFAYLVARVGNSRVGVPGALALSPFLWVAVELGRARVTGFPWDFLGNSQIDNSLLTHVAPLAGVMGMSFVVAAASACVAAAIVLRGRRGALAAASGLVVALVVWGGGSVARQAASVAGGESYAVLMQENLSVGAAARATRPLSPSDELGTFSAMSLHPGWADGVFVLPANSRPALIVWPEAPSHFRSDDPTLQWGLSGLARVSGAAVIAGDIGIVFDSGAPKGYYEYDSASMFDPAGVGRGRYDKIHLVPWGEYVPFKHLFGFAGKLTEGVGDMDPGQERSVLRTGGHGYGVFICYESIFGDEVRQFVRNGAEVLVNISDDGWYGDTGAPWQHLNMARMRAIENDRYLIRSTNTGITTVIDPRGRVLGEAPRHVRGAFAFPYGYETKMTVYTRFGDWFAWMCVVVTMLGLGASFVGGPAKKQIPAK